MKFIAVLLIAFTPTLSHAMDVAGFEKLSKGASGTSMDSKIQDTVLKSYFSGVSDLLNAQMAESGKIRIGERINICMPFGVELNADVLRAMTVSEVRKARATGNFGKEMDEYFVSLFIGTALQRNYPCKEV